MITGVTAGHRSAAAAAQVGRQASDLRRLQRSAARRPGAAVVLGLHEDRPSRRSVNRAGHVSTTACRPCSSGARQRDRRLVHLDLRSPVERLDPQPAVPAARVSIARPSDGLAGRRQGAARRAGRRSSISQVERLSRAFVPRDGYTLVVNQSPREAETERCSLEEFVDRFGLKIADEEQPRRRCPETAGRWDRRADRQRAVAALAALAAGHGV